jgi:hypothetical protein
MWPGHPVGNHKNPRSKVERAGGSRGTRSKILSGRKGGYKVVCRVDRYDPNRIVGKGKTDTQKQLKDYSVVVIERTGRVSR